MVADDLSIGGFWLERGQVRILSGSEQKGRVIRWEGSGGAKGLDRYNLGHSVYATGQTLRGDRTIPGKWAWNDEPYGAMLVRVLEEGYDHPSANSMNSLTGTLTAHWTPMAMPGMTCPTMKYRLVPVG